MIKWIFHYVNVIGRQGGLLKCFAFTYGILKGGYPIIRLRNSPIPLVILAKKIDPFYRAMLPSFSLLAQLFSLSSVPPKHVFMRFS